VAKYEYARTCKRCQTQWFVPAAIAEAKPQKQARLAGLTTSFFGAKRQQLRAETAMIELHNQELAKSQQCSACGSSAYNQKKVRT
jgi:predicted nucleic-acid-binding Zn-ribbon protein